MLELPVSAPGVAVAEAIVGEEALRMLERDADARRLAAEAMRRAHDHGWVIVARGDLSGSVVCHAEAFFESMAAAEHSAHAIACPAGTVLEWSPGLLRPTSTAPVAIGSRFRSPARSFLGRVSRRPGASSS